MNSGADEMVPEIFGKPSDAEAASVATAGQAASYTHGPGGRRPASGTLPR